MPVRTCVAESGSCQKPLSIYIHILLETRRDVQHGYPQHHRVHALLRPHGKNGLLTRALRAPVQVDRVWRRVRGVGRCGPVEDVVRRDVDEAGAEPGGELREGRGQVGIQLLR